MDLHKIFSIGPQWANRYEVTLNLTQPHLPSFVITYHDLVTQLNQTLQLQLSLVQFFKPYPAQPNLTQLKIF